MLAALAVYNRARRRVALHDAFLSDRPLRRMPDPENLLLTYGLIILVVGLALAPLWHFKPTKQQKKQARMREAAALSGLFVELRDLPLAPEHLARMPASERQLLYYGCRLGNTRGEPRRRLAWRRVAGTWECVNGRESAPSGAAELPDSILALTVSEASCGLFWREDGDEHTVRELAEWLHRWRDEIGGN